MGRKFSHVKVVDKLSNLNHHISHGKFIVPAKLTGNSGIVHGQGTVHEIENKLNPVTSTAQTLCY
jgi:hypothetical protein